MKDVKITVLRRTVYEDLLEKYGGSGGDCPMVLGAEFICRDNQRPEGFCTGAWESVGPFAKKLAEGGLFPGFMKDPRSAMISCHDGFRPVTYLLEVME